MQSINDWLRQDSQIDKIQLIILTMTLIYCTEGIENELESRLLIEQNQQKYVMMLNRYLKNKYPETAYNR